MFLGLFGLLVLIWLISFVFLHVTGALIHILLVLAVISIVLHLLRGRNSGA